MHTNAIGLYTYPPVDDPERLIEVELPTPRPTSRPGCDREFPLVDERIVSRRRYPEREIGK
jgi:hypothetical protein